jgi:hypothetical protein
MTSGVWRASDHEFDYHLPRDTIDTLDFTFRAQLVKSLEIDTLDFTFRAQLVKSLELGLLELPPV